MSATLPKTVLLDLDDTILAYDDGVDECWRAACVRYAHRIPDADRLRAEISEYSRWYWSDPIRHREGRLDLMQARKNTVAQAMRRLGWQDDSLAGEMGELYSDLRDQRIEPFPGAIETLHELRRRGHRLGLVTNGSSALQRRKIRRFDLEKLFDCIVVEGEFGCGKPQARVFEHVLSQLGVPAGDACMVGDNLHADIAGANNVGIFSIWNDFRKEGLPENPPAKPGRIIHAIRELTLS